MKKLMLGIALFTLSQVPLIRYALADDEGLQLVTGTVNANGTSQSPTKLFTIAHPSNGRYIITFAPHVFGKIAPACIVMPLGSLTVAGITENVSSCDFLIVNLTGVPTDAVYNFMAAPITALIPARH
ncbi:MAG: hypothetical protein ACREDM_04200 [Methylocella sp.]